MNALADNRKRTLTVEEIIDEITNKVISKRLGCNSSAVSNVRAENGLFPASWYPVILSECDARGIACPLSMFRWKGMVPAEVRDPALKAAE